MWRTPTTPPDCWRRPPSGTSWVQRTCTRSSATGRASLGQCRLIIFHIVLCILSVLLMPACTKNSINLVQHITKNFFHLLCADGSGRSHDGLGDQGRESGNVSKGNKEFLQTRQLFLYFYILILFSPRLFRFAARTRGSRFSSRGPWRRRQRRPGRPEPRCVLCCNKIGERLRITIIGFKFYFLIQVIAAEGEQKASWALREASEVIAESSSALQLRYLQVRFFVSIQKNHLAQELTIHQIVCMEIVKNNS